MSLDPKGQTVIWKDLSYNIGDQPVTGIAFDNITGDLFIATDFGVAMLAAGTQTWSPAAGSLPPVAVLRIGDRSRCSPPLCCYSRPRSVAARSFAVGHAAAPEHPARLGRRFEEPRHALRGLQTRASIVKVDRPESQIAHAAHKNFLPKLSACPTIKKPASLHSPVDVASL